ncbi:MAG: 30S ribosomal protein S20 [Bacteroidetes bacterium]|nr:30S ribosomal protein S20 [Bacteroidota bacterium]
MANHKSAEKRIRANDSKRLRNRYYTKTARTAIKDLRTETDKTKAQTELPKITSMLDKLAKKNVIHKNKAANLKSKLTKFVNTLGVVKK